MRVATAPLLSAITVTSTQSDEVLVEPADDGVTLRARSVDGVTLAVVTIPMDVPDDLPEEGVVIRTDGWRRALSHAPEADIDLSLRGVVTVACGGFRTRMRLGRGDAVTFAVPRLTGTTAVTVVPAGTLADLSGDADPKHVFRHVFALGEDGMTVTAGDDDGFGTELTVPVDPSVTTGAARAAYPVKAWQAFLRAVPKGADLCLEWGTDYPLMATWEHGGTRGTWLVAPFIEEK